MLQTWSTLIIILALLLQGCASPKMSQELERGKLTFEAGDFKQAFHQLLPVAVMGRPEAQYAVGYMYYYGYGVPEDTESGLFWMQKAADQMYVPAIQALALIHQPQPVAASIIPPPAPAQLSPHIFQSSKVEQQDVLRSLPRKSEPLQIAPTPQKASTRNYR